MARQVAARTWLGRATRGNDRISKAGRTYLEATMGRVPEGRSKLWSRAVAAGDARDLLAAETDGLATRARKEGEARHEV